MKFLFLLEKGSLFSYSILAQNEGTSLPGLARSGAGLRLPTVTLLQF